MVAGLRTRLLAIYLRLVDYHYMEMWTAKRTMHCMYNIFIKPVIHRIHSTDKPVIHCILCIPLTNLPYTVYYAFHWQTCHTLYIMHSTDKPVIHCILCIPLTNLGFTVCTVYITQTYDVLINIILMVMIEAIYLAKAVLILLMCSCISSLDLASYVTTFTYIFPYIVYINLDINSIQIHRFL